MPAEQSVNVSVQIDQSQSNNVARVVRALKHKGFVLREALDAIGVITGSAPVEAISALASIPGVSAVEQERNDYRTQ
jgi:hypothetical protein